MGDPEHGWGRMAALFDEAVGLSPDERREFLDRRCGDDETLRRGLVDLLAAADRASGFLGQPLGRIVDESTQGTTVLDSTVAVGDRIGPYRLLAKLGEGGMGEVWRAEQSEPIKRHVAIKVIKSGMDTRRVVARFEAERQALAWMDHPAIAHVFDAGATPRGLPYFVMELVAGEPITKYCDRQQLSIPERLRLFREVCEGVQHAHQKGIIHRDLKPSNVLVSVQGEKPVPRIIDFGVAKASAGQLTDGSVFTEVGMLIGTLEYVSPEQAEMTGTGVDTRTDVYSLGVMLYELLTGTLPFPSRELREAGFEEVRKRIREEEPPRPSTRVRTLGDTSAETARSRATDPPRLVSRLRGELDWIVMRAMEKDRTRRYGSPGELAADLDRYLANEPVSAGPPGAAYRAKKFVRRHRVGVAFTAAAFVILAAFAVNVAVQNRRIAAERDRADREAKVSRRVTDFMTGLFEVSDPGRARGNTITAREILDRGSEKIRKELDDEPEVKAQLLLSMGRVYQGLGLYDTAASRTREAVELYDRRLGPQHRLTLGAQLSLAITLDRQGRYSEAESILRKTLEIVRRTLGEDDYLSLDVLNRLAAILERQGRNEEAAPLYRRYLEEIKRKARTPDDNRLLWATQNVGWNLTELGRYAEAEPILREAADSFRRVLGEDHPETMQVVNNLAQTLHMLGRLEEAETHCRGLVEAKTRVLGREHPSTNAQIGMLASVLGEEGRTEESEALFLRALEIQRRTPGVEHPYTLLNLINLGGAYARWGRFDDASRVLNEAYAAALRSEGPTGSYTGSAAYTLASAYALRGDRDEALEWLLKSAAGHFGGYTAEQVVQDADLNSLHGDPEFERILAVVPGSPPGPQDPG